MAIPINVNVHNVSFTVQVTAREPYCNAVIPNAVNLPFDVSVCDVPRSAYPGESLRLTWYMSENPEATGRWGGNQIDPLLTNLVCGRCKASYDSKFTSDWL